MTSLVLGPTGLDWGRWMAAVAPRSEGSRHWASDDEALIRAIQGGSEEAFSVLVQRHQQGLRAFLRRACGDWGMADDLAQEVFMTAWSGIHRIRQGASLRAWLCGIGYRKAMTAFRSDRRSRRREEAYQDMTISAETPDHEGRLSLERAMAALPLDQRACVALCLAAEFTHPEAAEALGLPLGTVKSHVQRGRARLLEALGVADDAV